MKLFPKRQAPKVTHRHERNATYVPAADSGDAVIRTSSVFTYFIIDVCDCGAWQMVGNQGIGSENWRQGPAPVENMRLAATLRDGEFRLLLAGGRR